MTSSADRSSSIFAPPSAGRRILHRFASPFGQKTRSISEFTVRAHDPHKQYSPGESVSGAVIVKVVKPIRLTHISVCLHGFVQVHKTPGSPAEAARGYGSRIGKAQGKKSGEYFGNGFASLFEDEQVLCGEGRLAEGSYRFDFEVAFPKDIDLPSSIEFERGSISYMVTATLTRPTTMNPTMSHDQRLYLCERIDIATLLPPKPRTITLEPVSRKTRPKSQPKRLTSERLPPEIHAKAGTSSLSTNTHDSTTSSMPNVTISRDPPRSPSLSEVSLDSRVSGSVSRLSASGSAVHSQRTSDSLNVFSGSSSPSDKTITATVESQKGGCLRGDSIPVKISISHTKHVKSINGVIITLYRLARVDLHPALPLGPMSDGQKRKYEDYYPKSLTGLGGLSLSGAGSSHVFRKDLAQTIVPLIVDPHTLQSEINAKVRVPEDAFPTINTVPGSMISFRYYIEVVLDIQGKLSGTDKFFSPRTATQETNGPPTGEHSSLFELQGPGILDTAPIRRDKSVVTSMFEVVVGTLDSERRKGKARARTPPDDEHVVDTSNLQPNTTTTQSNAESNSGPVAPATPTPHPEWYDWHHHAEPDWSNYYPDGYGPHGYDAQYGYEHDGYPQYYDYNSIPQFIPPPPMEDEAALPEKERLRRAEARLMPSGPPQVPQDASWDGADGPSAPELPSEHYLVGNEIVTAGPSQSSTAYSPERASTRVDEDWRDQRWTAGLPEPGGTDSQTRIATSVMGDDKQELRRQQLQSFASSPPQMIHLENATAGAEPSAPTLEDGHADHEGGDNLPRYSR